MGSWYADENTTVVVCATSTKLYFHPVNMEHLLKQILLLSENDRKKLLAALRQSIEMKGEDFLIQSKDIRSSDYLTLASRLYDIHDEKVCLVEFDDHVLGF